MVTRSEQGKPSAGAPKNGATAPKKPVKPHGASTSPTWDDVDEASWESFPASDAPASWAGKDREAPSALADEEQGNKSDEDKN